MEQELVQVPLGREVGRAHLSCGWRIGKVGTAKPVQAGQVPGQLHTPWSSQFFTAPSENFPPTKPVARLSLSIPTFPTSLCLQEAPKPPENLLNLPQNPEKISLILVASL